MICSYVQYTLYQYVIGVLRNEFLTPSSSSSFRPQNGRLYNQSQATVGFSSRHCRVLTCCSMMPSQVMDADVEGLNITRNSSYTHVSRGRPRGLFRPVGGLLIAPILGLADDLIHSVIWLEQQKSSHTDQSGDSSH